MRQFRKLKPVPKQAHPFIKTLFATMSRERIGVTDVAERAGVHYGTLIAWRTRATPDIESLRACLNVVGLDLTITRLDDEMAEVPEEREPRPFGLTPQEHGVYLELATGGWKSTLALCIASVEAHEEPLLTTHLKVLISRIRAKTGRLVTYRDGGYEMT